MTVMIDVDGAATANMQVSVSCFGQTLGNQAQVCTDVSFTPMYPSNSY